MANKGGPPDLEEVLKDAMRAITRRNRSTNEPESARPFGKYESTSYESNKRDEAFRSFDTNTQMESERTSTQPRQKKRSPPVLLYLILAFGLYVVFAEFFPGIVDGVTDSVSDIRSGGPNATDSLPVIGKIREFIGEINMFESMGFALLVGAVILLILFLRSFVRIVPQNEAFVVERLGKYDRTLLAGFHITIPILERVAYKHSLKEYAIDVASQHAITRDNVVLGIDGVLYLKIMDARAASYGVENLQFAITQLAQTSMRAEIGKLSLDDTFESRENINAKVTQAIDEASEAWGTKVLRYEVKDITPPASILEEMEKQMGAERQRRVAVTTSEGYRQAQINQAEGDREAQILRAQGTAESLTIEATARAEAIRTISEAINEEGGSAAVAQQLAEQYVSAFDKLAREGTIALLPGDGTDVASMVAKAYTAFDGLKNTVGANKPSQPPRPPQQGTPQ